MWLLFVYVTQPYDLTEAPEESSGGKRNHQEHVCQILVLRFSFTLFLRPCAVSSRVDQVDYRSLSSSCPLRAPEGPRGPLPRQLWQPAPRRLQLWWYSCGFFWGRAKDGDGDKERMRGNLPTQPPSKPSPPRVQFSPFVGGEEKNTSAPHK